MGLNCASCVGEVREACEVAFQGYALFLDGFDETSSKLEAPADSILDEGKHMHVTAHQSLSRMLGAVGCESSEDLEFIEKKLIDTQGEL